MDDSNCSFNEELDLTEEQSESEEGKINEIPMYISIYDQFSSKNISNDSISKFKSGAVPKKILSKSISSRCKTNKNSNCSTYKILVN